MALLEGEEIRETMNQEIVLVPRMTVSWTNKFKGIATKKQLYQMQKQLTAQVYIYTGVVRVILY
jgi:hypothetical protein